MPLVVTFFISQRLGSQLLAIFFFKLLRLMPAA